MMKSIAILWIYMVEKCQIYQKKEEIDSYSFMILERRKMIKSSAQTWQTYILRILLPFRY